MDKDPSKPQKPSLLDNTRNSVTPKTWNNIESEMLLKVLLPAYSLTSPKEMASRRLVCKHWRDVIDEHFEYWLTLNDPKFDVKYISHLKVKNCTVISLSKELGSQQQIFKSPQSLDKLFIWGKIHPKNFHLLLNQVVNLKHLSLDWEALITRGLMDEPEPEDQERFQEFWNGLNTLETSFDAQPHEILIDNMCKLLSFNMQSLSALKIRGGFESPDFERFYTTLYSFLESSSNRNLKTLHFNSFFKDVKIPLPQTPLRFMGDNQLESLRLSLIDDLVPYWIPVIQAQRELKDFRLHFRVKFLDDRYRNPSQLRQVLESTLPLNRTTLNTVELSKFYLSDDFDANIFRDMEKLRRLVLLPCQSWGKFQRLLNLEMLPNSIETLVLGKVSVDCEKLKMLVDRLDNIKVLEILSTDIISASVMKEVFEILTRKEKIRRITMNPLFESTFPWVSKNGKFFLLVNGYEMEILWKNATPSINFLFP